MRFDEVELSQPTGDRAQAQGSEDMFRSPLDAPIAAPEPGPNLGLPALVFACAALVAASAIASALVIRSERTHASTHAGLEAISPEHGSEARDATPRQARLAAPSTPIASVANATTAAHLTGAAELVHDRPELRSTPPATPPRHSDSPDLSSLPTHPSRGQVIAAMRRVTPATHTCLGAYRGVAKVSLVFSGKTGRVTSAGVSGPNRRIATCVRRAVRRARLPRFRNDTLEIVYPFAL